MIDKETKKRGHDMPDDVRLIIQRETDEVLRRFRAGNFDSRLQTAGPIRPEEARFEPRLFRRAWIPVFGLAFAAMVIISAALWFSRAKPLLTQEGLWKIDAALSDLPGFRTLSLSDQIEPLGNEIPSPDVASVSQALASAGRSAAVEGEAAIPSPGRLVPRYSLEQKMKILFGDKTIEQALSLFKEKFKEV